MRKDTRLSPLFHTAIEERLGGASNEAIKRHEIFVHASLENIQLWYDMAGEIIVCFAIPGDREIKALIVRCDNGENGCCWVGELRQFSDHTSKCEYSKAECPNKCGQSTLRYQLNNHMKNECLLRAVKCPDCKQEGTFWEIINIHPHTCLKAKIPCPRKCGSTIARRNLDLNMGSEIIQF